MFQLPTNPLTDLEKATIKYVLILLAGVFIGYKLTANHYDAKAEKTTQAVLEQVVKDSIITRQIVENYKTDLDTLRAAYKTIGEKARVTKITTTNCTLTPDGVSLWNESLSGKTVLPSPSSGIVGTGGADFADAFANKLLNDQGCAANRAKIEKLKEWDKEQFGDR